MENNKHTSPFLFFLCFLFCLAAAAAVTQPSAGLSPMKNAGFSEVISADKEEAIPDVQTEEAVTEETSAETSAAAETAAEDVTAAEETAPEETTEPAQISEPETAESTEAPVSQAAVEAAADYTVSPEAASGSWSKAGGEWFFVTDGNNYHGWLYDTDGHVYYLNPENGVMTTGWLELDGNRYYFNADGVMQTGDTEVDGQIYHFNSNGILEGGGTSAEAQPEIVITAVPAKTS